MKLFLSVQVALIIVIALGVLSANQEQPATGERRGNRCYNGRMWVDCGLPEKPEPPTHVQRQWQIAAVDGGTWTPRTQVHVIDTAGVCLYLALTEGGDRSPSITAMPKTQLPKGAGCQ